MAKNGHRRKRANESAEDGGMPMISPEAARGVGAILLIALSVFLVLAGLHLGGRVGEFLYVTFTRLFGVGYMLFPASLILLSIAVIRSFEQRFGVIQIASSVIFLLAGLGLINIAFPGKSGVVGSLVTAPLTATIDTVATIIFLVAFILAALIIAFDIHLGVLLNSLRMLLTPLKREEAETKPLKLVSVVAPHVGEAEEEPTKPAPPIELTREKKVGPAVILSDGAVAEFPVITASTVPYIPPPLSLLGKNKGKPEVGDVKANMNLIKRTLQNFGIHVEMDEVSIGPTVTRYAMKPAEGVRLSKIVALQSNLELALASSPIRIEAPIPGKSLVGIEVPNIARTMLGLAPLLAEAEFGQSAKPLLIGLGRSISGGAHFTDLARMPHMLVAGATGAGKSVTIHDFVISLLYRCGPERLRFIMVDPKRVELTAYNNIPHLFTPVITDAKKAIQALKWLAKEMDRRYNILETEKVRDISSYHENVVAPAIANSKGEEGEKMPEAMPYIVVIIDELADIMQLYPRELEACIVRLAQMSRAVGIHLILSTQRPDARVITGLIKANIPCRVALKVNSHIESRIILDQGGAEKLLGAGDMLYLSSDSSKPRRIQAPYTSESEVHSVVKHIIEHNEGRLDDNIDFATEGKAIDPIFTSGTSDERGDEDEMYAEAKRVVVEAGKASTSFLQRKLGVGYARAARLIDTLEERGVIGPGDGAKPRSVIGAGNADELAQEPVEENEEAERLS